ncbi:Arc family DNA binding domain-containing protein [Pedobacter sp. MR2016-24]|uniref:Arc family DNA binding domain-containing protein n=1 Tax=Pedobacter sp. MR2016-24 TaxID=2994466 RepID=UPI00224815AC|nr:Arc family DNA binding domain-containing protein [Pedobacter sp. MR2016-24]MCX2486244.1 Arc family DNA binding domain-containing protein [Pedobacter sp. MR2016-24]
MSDKKSFALRIDSETMKAIEKWAADEFRSVNGQIEWMLNKSLKDAKRLKAKNEKKDDPEIRS